MRMRRICNCTGGSAQYKPQIIISWNPAIKRNELVANVNFHWPLRIETIKMVRLIEFNDDCCRLDLISISDRPAHTNHYSRCAGLTVSIFAQSTLESISIFNCLIKLAFATQSSRSEPPETRVWHKNEQNRSR